MKSLIKWLVMVLCLMLIGVPIVQAAPVSKADPIQAIAKSAPGYLLGPEWDDVKEVKSTPLYDFDEKLIAYSVDLKRNADGAKAYAIVSVNEDDGPILQFAEGVSPFAGNKAKSVYGGPARYFSLDNGKYNNLADGKELDATEVESRKETAKNHKYVSRQPETSKALRTNLTEGTAGAVTTSLVTTASVPPIVYRNLVDYAPDWTWYLGCAPTAAGEVIKNNFHSNSAILATSKSTLVSRLATNMHTDANGNTVIYYFEQGILATLSSYGISGHAVNDYEAPFQSLINNIEADRAMIVSVDNNVTYGDHSMCAMGFAQGTSGTHYIVLHTNAFPAIVEGDVYADYESSSFNNPYSNPVLTAIY